MPFYTRDWLDNKELRRCSPTARATLADLMCLAHEGRRYGYLEDDVETLTVGYMAHRCHLANRVFLNALSELKESQRIQDDGGVLFIPRMVREEAIRVARSEGGKGSIGHPNTHPPKENKGYPSSHPSVDPLLEIDSRAHMRADSVCVSSFPERKESAERKPNTEDRYQEFITPWPRLGKPDDAFRAWLSVVNTAEDVTLAFAARDRYLASDEVARGVCAEPSKWLFDQSRGKWAGKWPAAAKVSEPRKVKYFDPREITG